MPGDAWGALALPNAGEGAREVVNSFGGLIGGAALNEQVRRSTGLDLEADVYSWLGDIGGFVRGTSEAELGGALVLESTDDDRAASAFGKFVGLIGQQAGVAPEPVKIDGAESAVAIAAPEAPQQLVLARGEGKMVAAYSTDAAAEDALSPDAKLGDSATFKPAEETLGDDMNAELRPLGAGDHRARRRVRRGGRGLRGGAAVPRGVRDRRDGRFRRRRHGPLADRGDAEVGARRHTDAPVSAGISAAATSSRTDGTSRSATTSWIFGAARAACSASRRA